ncbi:MAG: oxidoreductase, partial [Chloroflexi bacterium]|nr:oxidoreductase [Chloroflexota bacterium]
MRDPLRLSLAAAHELALQALLANGVSAAQAAAIADNVTAAERDGCVSHGLFR